MFPGCACDFRTTVGPATFAEHLDADYVTELPCQRLVIRPRTFRPGAFMNLSRPRDLSSLQDAPRHPAKPRHKTREVRVGNRIIGGDNPIVVQSMTTTDTFDVEATIAQIKRLEEAGCELV